MAIMARDDDVTFYEGEWDLGYHVDSGVYYVWRPRESWMGESG